jgi:hypothetical protein
MPERRKNSRVKEDAKPLDDGLYRADEVLHKWSELGALSALIEGYIGNDIALRLEVFGYLGLGRRNVEHPPLDLQMTFERDPRRVRAVPPLRRHPTYGDGYYSAPYNMKVSVLVDDVEPVQVVKRATYPLELIVPSVVRLKVRNRTPLLEAQPLDRVPLVGGDGVPLSHSGLVEDRERGLLLGVGGDVPPVPPDVERVDDVVERRAEVEEAVARPESEWDRVERWDLSDAEDVLETVSVALSGSRISVAGNLPCESFLVQPCALPLLFNSRETPGHRGDDD